jgi:hypothetical protein
MSSGESSADVTNTIVTQLVDRSTIQPQCDLHDDRSGVGTLPLPMDIRCGADRLVRMSDS